MSADRDESVAALLAAYHRAGDRGDLDAFVALFTEDGRLETRDLGTHVGRDGIRRFMERRRAQRAAVDGGNRLRHHLAEPDVRFDDGGATSVAPFLVVGARTGLDHWGVYRDRLVQTSEGGPFEGWRFAIRSVEVVAHSAASARGRLTT